jgi:hypothetical protein
MFPAENLLLVALATAFISLDAVRRLQEKRRQGEIGPTGWAVYLALLLAGNLLTWIGFFLRWQSA